MTFLVLAVAACGSSSSSSGGGDAGGGGDSSTRVCTPGQSIACVGVGGCSGGQVCASDGSGYGACQCGSGDGGGSDAGSDGALDGAVDAPGITDTGSESHQVLDSGPLVCGTQTCASNTECCSVPGDGGFVLQCLASCPDGGAPFQCDSPQQCPAGMSVCCGTLQLTGAGTSCSFGVQTSSCTTACSTAVTLSCPSAEVVQFCAQKADCTDPNNSNCCTLTFGGRAETFCLSNANAQEAMFLGASCLQ